MCQQMSRCIPEVHQEAEARGLPPHVVHQAMVRARYFCETLDEALQGVFEEALATYTVLNRERGISWTS